MVYSTLSQPAPGIHSGPIGSSSHCCLRPQRNPAIGGSKPGSICAAQWRQTFLRDHAVAPIVDGLENTFEFFDLGFSVVDKLVNMGEMMVK